MKTKRWTRKQKRNQRGVRVWVNPNMANNRFFRVNPGALAKEGKTSACGGKLNNNGIRERKRLSS